MPKDAAKGFLPATGTIRHLDFPDVTARIDAGIRPGDTVSAHYDPLIAKMVVHGPTRGVALLRLTRALQSSPCRRRHHQSRLSRQTRAHRRIYSWPSRYRADRSRLRSLTAIEPPVDTVVALAAVLSLGALMQSSDGDPWLTLGHWQLWSEMQRIVG